MSQDSSPKPAAPDKKKAIEPNGPLFAELMALPRITEEHALADHVDTIFPRIHSLAMSVTSGSDRVSELMNIAGCHVNFSLSDIGKITDTLVDLKRRQDQINRDIMSLSTTIRNVRPGIEILGLKFMIQRKDS